MASIYIETLGCQMNEADSQYIADRAVSAGYAIAEKPEEANVVVLNTCTVRDHAERRAYGRLSHLNILKKNDPSVKLVMTGCLAEQDRDRARRRVPGLDAIFGTKELVQLGDAVAGWREEFRDTTFSLERELAVPLGGAADCVAGPFSHLRGFVTVQRGCSYYCTFCIVPHVRGRFDHRPAAEIVAQARELVEKGAREVMLVGQTVNAYRDPRSGAGFGDLCRRLGEIGGLERLTFISPHPKDFTQNMVRDMADVQQLNPRIHLPLQSASDRLLRRMNRKYTLAEFQERVSWIRRYLPAAAITTDVIVGFPGETEDDFLQTLEYIRSGVFANAFTFIYSKRRGTPAAHWEQVPADVVADRFKRLTELQNALTRAYHERKIGTTVRALIEGISKKNRTNLAARALDNVTIVAPLPDGYDESVYAREPWLDIRVEAAYVWGCSGVAVRRAEQFRHAGEVLEPPAISLLTA